MENFRNEVIKTKERHITMKHLMFVLCLIYVAELAAASENWWQFSPDKGFRFESLPAQVVLYEPGWNILSAKKLNQQGLFQHTITPEKDEKLNCNIRFLSPEQRKVQELALEFQLPAKTTFVQLDKLKVDLPQKLNDQKWIILA